MGHDRPVEPFSDVHFIDGKVLATLLHDPTVEGLDVGLYLDGSASMREEYEYTAETPRRTFLQWLTGQPRPQPGPATNLVEPQARWMLKYLASKDRNGVLRVAYWASGGSGKEIEVAGDLAGTDVEKFMFPGPKAPGGYTYLGPAIRDYVQYLKRQVKDGARRGLAVFITDGHLHDAEEIDALTADIANMVRRGQLPRVSFVLVGVGDQINEEELEHIAHAEHAGVGHIWCHRVAKEIQNVAEIVAGLVDETMTVAAGGTIYDDQGNAVKEYEGRLPAVLEFTVPPGCKSFTLEVAGQRYVQPISEEEEGEEHHG